MKKLNGIKTTMWIFVVLMACTLSSFKPLLKHISPSRQIENYQLNKPNQFTLTYYGDTADLVYGIYGTGPFLTDGAPITQVVRYSDNAILTAVGITEIVSGKYKANFDVYNSGGLKIDHYSGQIVE